MKKLLGFFIVMLCLMFSSTAFAYTDNYTTFDTEGAVTVNSTEEAVSALREARDSLKEAVILRANPDVVRIENSEEGWVDLDDSISNAFNYGYAGGLYGAYQYDVCAGPSCSEKMNDDDSPGYIYYKVEFEYHDNQEERAEADRILSEVNDSFEGKNDAEKVKAFYDWAKENLPEVDDAYEVERNDNGIWGLVTKKGKGFSCATYAMTFQRFFEIAGIDSHIIAGAYHDGDFSHSFNVVKIEGKWYAIDYLFDYDYPPLLGRASLDELRTAMIDRYMADYEFAEKDYFAPESTDPDDPDPHNPNPDNPDPDDSINSDGEHEHEHVWVNPVVTINPTTTRYGQVCYTCEICGITDYETLPKLAKKANPIKVTARKVSFSAKRLKKKAQSISGKKVFTVKNSKGTVKYKKTSGNKRIIVNAKNGTVTAKKGLKKGKYRISVKVTAAGNSTYKAGTKKVTVTVNVKK